MVKMADIERIRWLALREGWSVRRIARELKLNRRTVAKWVSCPEVPVYRRTAEPPRPVLADYEQQIDQWLREDEQRPPKQRHTARRIFQRLRDECGYQGSEPTVRRYVAQARRKPAEAFVPLEFDPAEAQADFGEATAVIAGVRQVVQFFCLRLCYSGMPFVIACPHQRQEAFFEGLRRAFEALGGVPVRVTLTTSSRRCARCWRARTGWSKMPSAPADPLRLREHLLQSGVRQRKGFCRSPGSLFGAQPLHAAARSGLLGGTEPTAVGPLPGVRHAHPPGPGAQRGRAMGAGARHGPAAVAARAFRLQPLGRGNRQPPLLRAL